MQCSNSRLLSVAALAASVAQPAFAQRAAAPAAKDYPTKFIRIVVPYGAGAGPDVVGRIIADKIGPSLGQSIVFENRGGSGGALGTAGVGSVMQMAAELFAHLSAIRLTPVHYTGVPAALTDVISGQIELGFPAAPSALPFFNSGRLRVLGITAEKRWSKMPNVPTLDEAGVKGYKFIGWYGFWFPAGTPREYVNRIQSEVAKAVKDPAVRQRFDEQGLEGVGSTTEEFAKVIEEEFALNKKLTAVMGIVPQ
jgi:tripartite-type tricarboxylate transporter receptor subunit TctC